MRLIDADELERVAVIVDGRLVVYLTDIHNAPTVELQMGRMTNGYVIPVSSVSETNTCTNIAFDAGGHIYGVMGGDKIMEEFEKDMRGKIQEQALNDAIIQITGEEQ